MSSKNDRSNGWILKQWKDFYFTLLKSKMLAVDCWLLMAKKNFVKLILLFSWYCFVTAWISFQFKDSLKIFNSFFPYFSVSSLPLFNSILIFTFHAYVIMWFLLFVDAVILCFCGGEWNYLTIQIMQNK